MTTQLLSDIHAYVTETQLIDTHTPTHTIHTATIEQNVANEQAISQQPDQSLLQLKCNQDECETPIDDCNKQNQPNNAGQPCYFIGDDDDQISDEQQPQLVSSSDEQEQQQAKQPTDKHKQQQEQSQSQEQQAEQAVQQPQSDQDLQSEDQSSSQVDSNDEEQSEDEYPDDYDSQQQQINYFESIVKLAHHQSNQQQTQSQFLERYYKVKQALQAEQHTIKQQQALFSNYPPSADLQIRKMKVSQGLLSLINNNYVRRLTIESQRKRKQLQQQQQTLKQGEEQNKSVCSGQNRVQQKKIAKKVVFSDSIAAKVYKVDDEVEVIQQTAQQNQSLNIVEKGDKRLFTINLRNINFNQMRANRARLASSHNIAIPPQSNPHIPKQPQIINPTDSSVLAQAKQMVRQEDIKSNQTSSSDQLQTNQQVQVQPTPTNPPQMMCGCKQMGPKQQAGGRIQVCNICMDGAVAQS